MLARHLVSPLVNWLTGLPNRRSFFDALEQILADANRKNGRAAIGLVDLDGFKPVNDVYGHAAGDELLKLVADRLRPIIGRLDVAGREFALAVDLDDGAVVDLNDVLHGVRTLRDDR